MGEAPAEEALIPGGPAHLHLHLEPEERKRATTNRRPRSYTNRDHFFAAHSLDNVDRVPVTVLDLDRFIRELHGEQRQQRVAYVELRLSPRRFLRDGLSWDEFLATCHTAMRELAEPVVRGVLLVNRDSPADFVRHVSEVIEAGLPPTFVGVDLAGDERGGRAESAWVGLFETARRHGLGASIHAGEFGDSRDVWFAVDVLGAQRIGHGLAAATDPCLLDRLAADRIMVELSIGSNLHLGAVPGIGAHPARVFVDAAVPVCFNTDVPVSTGLRLDDELRLARTALGCQERDLVELQRAATGFAFRRA